MIIISNVSYHLAGDFSVRVKLQLPVCVIHSLRKLLLAGGQKSCESMCNYARRLELYITIFA